MVPDATTTCTLPKEPEMHEEHSGLLAGWFPGKECFQARFWKASIPGLSCRWAILGLVRWDTHGPQPQHPSALPVRPYTSRNIELITPHASSPHYQLLSPVNDVPCWVNPGVGPLTSVEPARMFWWSFGWCNYRSRSWWFNLNFSGLMQRIFPFCTQVWIWLFDKTLSPLPLLPLSLSHASELSLSKVLSALRWSTKRMQKIAKIGWCGLFESDICSSLQPEQDSGYMYTSDRQKKFFENIFWMLFSCSCLIFTFNFTKTNLINVKMGRLTIKPDLFKQFL